MDTEDVWKLVLGGVVTLVAGALLHQLQQGNRRRRRRREIREELELVGLLGEHPEIRDRLRRRLEVLLDQYEPSPEKLKERRVLMLLNGGALLVIVVMQWSFFDAFYEGDMPWWIGFVIGTTSAVVVSLINWISDRFLDLRAQDNAAAVTLKAELPRKQVTHPAPDAPAPRAE